jgi:hypothetical protein
MIKEIARESLKAFIVAVLILIIGFIIMIHSA